MRHANAADLDRLETLLSELRAIPGLIEKRRGVFYWKSRAFLHFHADDEVAYADVRLAGADFDRIALDAASKQRRLVAAIRRCVTAG